MEENWIKNLARSQIGKRAAPPLKYNELVQNALSNLLKELFEEAKSGAEIYNRYRNHTQKMAVLELPQKRGSNSLGFTIVANRHHQSVLISGETIEIQKTILVGYSTRQRKIAIIKGVYDGFYGVTLYMNERLCTKEELLQRLFISHHELSLTSEG